MGAFFKGVAWYIFFFFNAIPTVSLNRFFYHRIKIFRGKDAREGGRRLLLIDISMGIECAAYALIRKIIFK